MARDRFGFGGNGTLVRPTLLNYRIWLIVFPIAAIATNGCDRGIQGGRFTVSSTQSISTPGQKKYIVRGHDSRNRQEVELLSIEIALNDEEIHLNEEHGKTTSTFAMLNAEDKLLASLEWDRTSDTVVARDEKFDRKSGNTFVVRPSNGGFTVAQKTDQR